MANAQQEKLKEVLDAALKLPKNEQHSYISQSCRGDEEMRHEIESLLRMQANERNFETSVFSKGLRLMQQGNMPRETDKANQLVGQTIGGRYLIDSVLSRDGGMGLVYKAKDKNLGGYKVVVKVIKKNSQFNDDWLREQIKKEIGALLRLIGNNNVVRVLDSDVLSDGRFFIVQDYIDGVTLRELMEARGGQLNLDEFVDIISQVANALDEAHKKSIIHKDIKPDNIMIESGKREIKVIDWGIADVKRTLTQRTFAASNVVVDEPICTVQYASPEQLEGKTRLFPASDIYSLGVTAYELLTGLLPFDGDLAQIKAQQKEGLSSKPSALRAGIPSAVNKVFEKVLSYKPEDRYKTAGEFSDKLRDTLRLARKKSDAQVRGRPNVLTIALLVIAVFGIGFAVWMFYGNRQGTTVVPSPEQVVNKNTSQTPVPQHTFVFWLDWMRMSNGKPTGEGVLKATGREPFVSGDKIRINFSSSDDGYLYLLNEGTDLNGKVTFILQNIYRVKKDRPVQTDWLTFDKNTNAVEGSNTGVEKFWFVWSRSPLEQLEEFKGDQFVPENKTASVRTYLESLQSADLSSDEDSSRERVIVKGSGEAISFSEQFRHKNPSTN